MTDSEFSKVYFLIGVDENKMIHKYDVNISFQNNQGYLIMTNQLDEMTKFKNFKIIEYVMTNKCFLYDLEQQLFTPNQIDEIIDLEIPTNVLPANIFEESGVIQINITKKLEESVFSLTKWTKNNFENYSPILHDFFKILTKCSLFGQFNPSEKDIVFETEQNVGFVQLDKEIFLVLSCTFIEHFLDLKDANFFEIQQMFDVDTNNVQYLEWVEKIKKGFGVRISKFQNFHLPKPIMLRDGIPYEVQNDFDGKLELFDKEFFIPANIGSWTIVYERNQQDLKLLRKFIEYIKKHSKRKGLLLPKGRFLPIETLDLKCSEWKQLFQGCQNGFISYYMIVGDLQKNHYELKAAEALTSGVVTQHIKNATVEEGTKDRFIIKTIIHKINEKAGGLNFALKFNENSGNLNLNEKDEKVLVIGLSMSHSIEGDQAGSLAVGFSANYESEPCHFRGHCFSQSSQTKVIDFEQLRDSLEETIRRFYERNDCYPDRIVIIRNAESSELQNDIIDVEFDEIRQVVVNLCQNKPVLTFILLNKVEMTFLSSIEMPNLPGTFINKDDTNNQFYFIFEMKKIPQAFLATVFIDNSDNDLTLKQVKHFIHGLGHLSYHPRYDMPLPKPIDQAIYWAEHGRSLFNIIGQLEPDIKKLNLF